MIIFNFSEMPQHLSVEEDSSNLSWQTVEMSILWQINTNRLSKCHATRGTGCAIALSCSVACNKWTARVDWRRNKKHCCDWAKTELQQKQIECQWIWQSRTESQWSVDASEVRECAVVLFNQPDSSRSGSHFLWKKALFFKCDWLDGNPSSKTYHWDWGLDWGWWSAQ